MGFEPTQGDPIGLAVQRLNHSATSSFHSRPETDIKFSIFRPIKLKNIFINIFICPITTTKFMKKYRNCNSTVFFQIFHNYRTKYYSLGILRFGQQKLDYRWQSHNNLLFFHLENKLLRNQAKSFYIKIFKNIFSSIKQYKKYLKQLIQALIEYYISRKY